MIENRDNKNIWYLVGLIATDGGLSIDGRHIDITAKNKGFLQLIKDTYRINNKISPKYGSKKKKHRSYRIQISDRAFYDFLISIGLMPAKSLRIGPLKVPNEFFKDFLRGVIDGDGSIRKWTHPSNESEQWSLRIYSGSESFSEWLLDKIRQTLRAKGRFHIGRRGPSKEFIVYTLKYGKMAARSILGQCYYPQAICLQRKSRLAKKCIMSHRGWKTSKTVF